MQRLIKGWSGLMEIVPYSRPTLNRMVKDGKLLKPFRLHPNSRAVFWIASDIESWVALRCGNSEVTK